MPQLPMTKSAAVALLAAYGNSIDMAANDNIINLVSQKIEKQATEIESLAINAYKALGCKSGTLESMEKELNLRLASLSQETFQLNGVDLENNLLKDFQEANVYKFERQKEYDAFLRYIENQTNLTVESNLPQILNAALSEMLIGNIGAKISPDNSGVARFAANTISSSGEKVGGRFVGKASDVFSKMSGTLQTRFEEYFKTHQDIISKYSTGSNSTYNGLDITVAWEDIPPESFLQMTNTKGERRRFFEAYPELKDQILTKYKQKIMSVCNVSRKDLFESAIDQVMFAQKEGKDLDSFFGLTGANLIGRLGEVQALYYMLVLTDGNMSHIPEWIGGKGNPHADELLKSLLGEFGMQVKNTSSGDNQLEFDFQGFNMKTTNKKKVHMIQMSNLDGRKLPSLFGFTHTNQASTALQAASADLFGADGILPGQYSLVEGIETILAMYTFNIEYRWHTDGTKPKFFASGNAEFVDVRKRIEDLANKANKIMSLMAAGLMYMQNTNISKGNSNTLYLIAGTTIISAASILHQIAKEVKDTEVNYEKSSFKMGTGGTSTIVSVLNGDRRLSNLDMSLQSSYTFTK